VTAGGGGGGRVRGPNGQGLILCPGSKGGHIEVWARVHRVKLMMTSCCLHMYKLQYGI
jgi:hypothetical protein